MDRRDFFRTGVQAAAAGAAISIPACSSQAADTPAAETSASDIAALAIMKEFSAEDHRRRLGNIGLCTQKIRKCMRKHLVTNYLPGQACYNLGEYPCREPWDIGEYDEEELDRLKEHGIQLVQVFDDWNDSLRLFGGDKYTALNPAGFRRFVDMAHRRGIKVLAYTSTGFLQWTDPDFRQEWSPEGSRCLLGQAHPDGPHVYSGWDAVPPRAETRSTHARWLKQYRLLAEEGTWAYLEIGDSDLFAEPLPKDCVASAFANRELYLVLANYGQSAQQIETVEAYVPVDNPSPPPARLWQLPKRSLRIIKRQV